MRNFYEVNGNVFFNIENYMGEWEKYIGIYDKNGAEKKGAAQSLGSHVQKLWKNFNEDRSQLDKHYMETAIGLQAYISSFLLPNIERVFSLLVRDENIFAIESLLVAEKDELVISDFGCGPLSGSVAILALIEYILKQNSKLIAPKKISIYAIDRSEKVVELGAKFIKNSIITENSISIERLTSPAKLNKKIDIALCINVFNEIPEKHRFKTLKSIYDNSHEGALLLIMEPGQEEHAKALGALRDQFIENSENCEIISPCAHNKPCPLSQKTGRKDWCWFRHSWNPPASLKLIDKFSKIDHHELNFSYLFLQKNKIRSAENYFARCVSDEFALDLKGNKAQFDYFTNNLSSGDKEEFIEMTQYEGGLQKILLCTQIGALESAFMIADPEQKEYRRGRRIKESDELYMRAKERI
ncbi:small ribosomal subunit Rsm22 family protein [Fluviispira vulneris]|uniref:small ribosomal subunit Rsm22 family protein n=1 Tax=Fluviispira vulneris TaxID=2763012 RepID=UPI001647E662|nr:small ribosomal subunit Rsm22 family protein [Fluviispira vulneris]